MKQLTSIALFIALIFLSGCNNDEPRFSSSQIQNALFEMKGIYYGDMRVSFYQGDRISEGEECKVISKDSLTINMDLRPMASIINDEAIAARLRDIGVVEIKAGYEFIQMDDVMYSFILRPKDLFVEGGYGAPALVKIVFSQTFGGDAFYYDRNNIVFNLSPIELWVGGEKYEPLRQLVYHFEGSTDK